jgi:O-antigen ligase
MPGVNKWGDRLWVLVAALLWALVGALKLQVGRVIPFDALALIILCFVVFVRIVPVAGTRGTVAAWKPSANGLFYLSMSGLIFASVLSGLHAAEVTIWALEVCTFVYLALMLVSVDMFTSGQQERFLRIGAWVFAGLCGVFGVLAVAYLLGAPKAYLFYEFSAIRGYTEKFTGLMRYANQWSGYFVGVFPLTLALIFETKTPWKRILLLACAVLGAATVPSSGSRSGIFLLVFQTASFVGLYIMLSRKGRVLTRVVYVALFAVAAGSAYFLTFEVLGDSAIVQRSFGAFELVFEQEEFADSWRTYNWNAAWNEWLEHPIIGMGLGTFEIYYDKHEIHSSYLSFLAETGFLGVVFYVAVVAIPTLQLCRALAAGAARGHTDIWVIALLVAVGTQIIFAIHHNNSRHRHVWLVLLMASVYAEVAIGRIRAELRERTRAVGAKR